MIQCVKLLEAYCWAFILFLETMHLYENSSTSSSFSPSVSLLLGVWDLLLIMTIIVLCFYCFFFICCVVVFTYWNQNKLLNCSLLNLLFAFDSSSVFTLPAAIIEPLNMFNAHWIILFSY